MANNYFVVNRPSNLIIDVTTTSYTPEDTNLKKFVLASDKALDIYFKWMKASPGELMDIGDLMSRSQLVKDVISNGRSGKATPRRFRYRDGQQSVEADRLSTIVAWIKANPTADEYNLDDVFRTGILVAREYLKRYR